MGGVSDADGRIMPIEQSAAFRRYRAPQEDGRTLIDPPRPELADVVDRNRRHLARIEYDVQGQSLADLSASARGHLVKLATAYTRQYRDPPRLAKSVARDDQLPIVLSGHQPQLYHPGVWYKNFVLGALAREVRGVGIHFLIDSDLCRSVAIRVPSGSPERPTIATVPYDLPGPEIPYEERSIRDQDVFRSFADRASAAIGQLVDEPLVNSLWPLAVKRSLEHGNLGLSLAQGRHLLEASWHNETLELPQSAVCQLPEFNRFTAHLLAHLPRFQSAYNSALGDYRRAHRLRNRAQPVPDLATSDGWLEAPLWMWTSEDPERRPLFARRKGREIEITDRAQRTFVLSLADDGDARSAASQLADLANRGAKIRTRALATTLFARLVLGDIFLHGIGGAKYDQVTNVIARDFFGFDLPEFAAVSATLRLPVHRIRPATHDDAITQTLRALRYHPEKYLVANGKAADSNTKAAAIVAEKRRWIDVAKTPANARERHLAISAANAALQPLVEGQRSQLMQRQETQDDERRAAAILDSREYSFCLYPRPHIERMLLDTSQAES